MKKLTAAALTALALTGCGTPVAPTTATVVAAAAAPHYKLQNWLNDAINWTEDKVSDGADYVGDNIDNWAVDGYNGTVSAINTTIAAGNTAWETLDSTYNTCKTAIYTALDLVGSYTAVVGTYTASYAGQTVSYTAGAVVWQDATSTSKDYTQILNGAKNGVLVSCGTVFNVASACYTESRNGAVSLWNTVESLVITDGHLAIQQGTLRNVATGKYLSADNGGGALVSCNRTAADTWETFAFANLDHATLQHGDRVLVRTTTKPNFWSADNGGGSTLSATRLVGQGWELFTVCRVAGAGAVRTGDKIFLKACNGQNVSVPNGGTKVYCNAANNGPAEWFIFTAK